MVPGETPLDFLRKNLRTPVRVVEPETIVAKVEQERAEKAKAEAVQNVSPYEITPEAKTSTPSTTIDIRQTGEGDISGSVDGESEDSSKTSLAAENFKKLKTELKKAYQTVDEIKAEKARIEEEVTKYKTGEAYPEVLQEKENKIAELSRYEKLVSLKTSKEYQESFIKPLSTLESKFVEYGKEYNVPPEVMKQALNLKTTPEINAFLEEHFDGIAALEVKQVIKDMQGIQERAREAELEPAKELEKLKEQHIAIEHTKRVQIRNNIVAKSKDAWVKALSNVQQEGRITPLLYKENDTEFNQKYSIPLRTKAAQEYGRLITALTERGLEDLPEEEATALANYVLHAHASAVNFEFGKAALNYADELERSATHLSSLLRPDIGGAGGDSSVPQQSKIPDSPQAAARALLTNHVLSGR